MLASLSGLTGLTSLDCRADCKHAAQRLPALLSGIGRLTQLERLKCVACGCFSGGASPPAGVIRPLAALSGLRSLTLCFEQSSEPLGWISSAA